MASDRRDFSQWEGFETPEDVGALAQCLGERTDARVLVMGDDTFAAKAGALGGFATMMEPRNMAEGRLSAADSREFLAQQRVDAILALTPEREAFAQSTFALSRVPDCPLPLYSLAN